MDSVENTFQENVRHFQAIQEKQAKSAQNLSIFRLVFFLSTTSAIVYFANAGMLGPFGLLTPLAIAGFAVLVKQYNKAVFERDHAAHLKAINQEELARRNGDFTGLPSGNQFKNVLHPYSGDLDIFGENSLFQLINRASTDSGITYLAKWLKSAASIEEIKKRQKAIQELAPQLSWRQNFQALGRHFTNEESNIQQLLDWAANPIPIQNKGKLKAFQILMPILSIASIFTAIFTWGNYIFLVFPLVVLIINSRILRSLRELAEDILDQTTHNVKTLLAYKALIEEIEKIKFESELLQSIQSNFQHDTFQATKEINRLQKILNGFQHRGSSRSHGGNFLYGILNVLFLLDIYWILKTERWQKSTQSDLQTWFDAIGQIEAISSFAGFTYANPNYAFPEITASSHYFEATDLGHPLIPENQRVSNSFKMMEKGDISVITGSNMAGKSTFLRTVGINTVLALSGSPVCASSMQTSPLQVFTSMRTNDNLKENTSSFYAELKRLKQLLELLREGKPILFLLDEILKGTNSEDRHKGAFALIRQLSKLNAFGLVSTHDLALGKLAEEQNNIRNFSFNSEIKGDKIQFDYKLTNGICKGFNASKLMERIGIEMS